MEYTILILLLPFLSFLALGLGGKWMSHRIAGTIGTAVLGVVVLLSYITAWLYFSAPRLADGTYETLVPYNITWLPFTSSHQHRYGHSARPDFSDDADCHQYRIFHGTPLLFWIHER